jgi:hypothetical protein
VLEDFAASRRRRSRQRRPLGADRRPRPPGDRVPARPPMPRYRHRRDGDRPPHPTAHRATQTRPHADVRDAHRDTDRLDFRGGVRGTPRRRNGADRRTRPRRLAHRHARARAHLPIWSQDKDHGTRWTDRARAGIADASVSRATFAAGATYAGRQFGGTLQITARRRPSPSWSTQTRTGRGSPRRRLGTCPSRRA